MCWETWILTLAVFGFRTHALLHITELLAKQSIQGENH